MNGRRKVATILAGAALAAVTTITSAGASGTNLLTNGNLMPTTNGWAKVGPGTFETMPGAGGKLISTAVTMDDTSVAAVQCLNLEHTHASYNFSGSLRVPEIQTRNGGAYVRLTLHGGAGCAGGTVDSVETSRLDETSGWTKFDLDLERTNDTPARSANVALVVEKDSTNRFLMKNDPFEADFKQLSLVVTARGDETADDGTGDWPASCIMFGGGGCPGDDDDDGGPAVACTDECPDDDDDDAPWDGPIACEVGTEGCPGEEPHEPAVPVLPDTKDEPADDPFFPDFPQEDEPNSGTADDSPSTPTQDNDDDSDGSHDTPANPGSPATPGVPSTGGNNGNNGGQDNPSSQGGASQDGKPQEKPTLQTQTPDTTINVATPTPPRPATGGDNPNDPATDLSNGEGDSSEVARSEDGDSGAQLPIIGGSLAALLALLGLGIVLKRASRS